MIRTGSVTRASGCAGARRVAGRVARRHRVDGGRRDGPSAWSARPKDRPSSASSSPRPIRRTPSAARARRHQPGSSVPPARPARSVRPMLRGLRSPRTSARSTSCSTWCCCPPGSRAFPDRCSRRWRWASRSSPPPPAGTSTWSRSGADGLLVPPLDPAAWAGRSTACWATPRSPRRLGPAGRHTARDLRARAHGRGDLHRLRDHSRRGPLAPPRRPG